MDSNDPRMMILDADPAKYIRTPSGAVVVMIKAAEGYAAYFLGLRMLELVKAVFPICSFMPIEILSLLVPKKTAGFFIPAEVSKVFYPRLVFGGLNIVNILGTAAAAAVCVILACILLEAVLSVLLFALLIGSRLLAITRRLIYYATIVLTLSLAGSLGLHIYCYFFNAKGDGAVRLMTVTLVLTLLFLLRISYERSASTVLSAIANEISTGFKELLMDNVKLGRDTLIFTLVFAASAFLSARLMTWQNLYVLAFGLLAFKHLAIYSSWKDFCLCHM